MRAILVTVLLVLFMGVNMTAAFSAVKTPFGAVESTANSAAQSARSIALDLPHHGACCEENQRPGPVSQSAHCSADCLSLQPHGLPLLLEARAEIEFTSPPALTAHGPGPVLQPPISL